MKALEVKNGEVEIGGNAQQTAFSVKIDGHIFKLMTDGLYSQKVPSVVREILANAIDAQIQSGRDEAVRVSLPTSFNKTFRVRDFGNGMSDDFVRTLYTQLGHSTKRDDNTQTGYFGMGSKSPFTITDQFQITVFDGAQKRVYSAYISESGIPMLMGPQTVASKDASGVEISIPVQTHLVSEFENAIKNTAFAYFDKNISFNRDFGSGEQPLDWAQKSFNKIADGVYTLRGKRDAYSYNRTTVGSTYIRQGFAVYPLEMDQITKQGAFPQGLTTVLRKLTARNTAVYFDAPLGTFNVTASREKIQYDKPSVENLRALMPALLKQTVEQLAAQMKGVMTFRDARTKLYNEAVKEFSVDEGGKPVARVNLDEVFRAVKDNFEIFKDEVIQNATDHAKAHNAPLTGTLSKVSIHERDVITSAKISSATYNVYHDGKALIPGANFSRHETTVVQPGDLLYVVPAVVKHWQDRVLAHATEQAKKMLPSNFDGTFSCTIHVVRCNRADADPAAQKFFALADNTVYTVYGEDVLPAYVPTPNSISAQTKRTYSKTAVYTVKRSGPSYNWAWAPDKVEADLGEDAVYVTREGITSRVKFGDDDLRALVAKHSAPWAPGAKFGVQTTNENYAFFQLVHAAIEAGVISKDTPIYRVTERQQAKMIEDADDCNWQDFGHAIVPKMLAALDDVHGKAMPIIGNALKDRDRPRWAATLVEEIRDLAAANEWIAAGGKFADATKRFIKEAEVFNTALFDLPPLLKSDAFALMILPTLYMDGTGPFKSYRTDLNKTATIRAAAKKLFSMLPEVPQPKTPKGYDKLFTELKDEFALLADLNYIRPLMGRHVMRYLTASVADAKVSLIAAKDYPDLLPLLKIARDYLNGVVNEFTKHQTANKGTN